MENSFQTSFIPKKPVTTNVLRKQPKSLFSILSVFILVVIGLASAGLFLYKNYLVNQKEVLSTSLEKVSASFEKDTIDELELYDKRSSAAKQVLNGHIVLSPMLSLLGSLTIPSIQYTKFQHETTEKGFFVKISGLARDYRSIALQADVFNSTKGRSFKNVVFSNLTTNKAGLVGFDLEFIVDPSLLSYEKNNLLEKAQVRTQPQIQTEVPIPVDGGTEPGEQALDGSPTNLNPNP
jgi:hypothetical protein